jgi:hypothetical protein
MRYRAPKEALHMAPDTGVKPWPAAEHELRFVSLFDAGRAIAFPCDAEGHVDLDRLPERLRVAYLGARAMIGREYGYPTVQITH